MGRTAMTPRHSGDRPKDASGELVSNPLHNPGVGIDLDEYCDDPDTGIGNVSIGFDGDPEELMLELRTIFWTRRKFEVDE